MKFPLILISFSLLSACAFKKDQTLKSYPSISPLSANYDWNSALASNNSSLVKAKRALVQNGDLSVEASTVTIPLSIPNPLVIENDYLGEVRSKFAFAKGFITSPAGKIEILIDAQFSDQKLKFQIDGLKNAFSEGISQEANLTIELYSTTARIFTYAYKFRTPPSKISYIDLDVYQDGGQNRNYISTGLISPEINNERFALVQMVEVRNDEDLPIEITYPSSSHGTFKQDVTSKVYSDLGCFNGSFSYTSNDHVDLLSNDLCSVALDENVLRNLGLISASTTGAVQSIRIEARSSARIGIYAEGTKVHSWATGEMPQSTLQTKLCQTGCYYDQSHAVCTSNGDDHGTGGHSGGGHGSLQLAQNIRDQVDLTAAKMLPPDVCVAPLVRHTDHFSIGDQRKISHLHIDNFSAKVRYFDVDQITEEGVRTVQIFTPDLEVQR